MSFRIIEIAGGREIYSQSRSKAVRKSKNVSVSDDQDKKRNQKLQTQGVWELRSHCNDFKKLKNSKEITETVFSSEVCSVTHQQLDRLTTESDQKVVYPVTKMSIPADIVVFDDIGGVWQDGTKKLDEQSLKQILSYNHAVTNAFDSLDSESDQVTKVIGNLPIAVYEGSPRRYGSRQLESYNHPQLPSAQSLLASPSVYPPRPGFPQRVVTTSNDVNLSLTMDSNNFNVRFMLLYYLNKMF